MLILARMGACPPASPSTPPPAAILARGDCRAPSAPRQPAGAARSQAERGGARSGQAAQDGIG